MKSKLTLRIRGDVTARAKAIAAEQGTSVSQMVETYFQMLAERVPETTGGKGEGESSNTAVAHEDALSPRIQTLQTALGHPAPNVEPDDDTRRWIEHAATKHE
jgi:hypothetical protein